ncbi:LLM class flavin-dependent oxidoreductase [Corynebacterium kozikiae]|uniref:LLM class flavin-dependent oxidoreductase n=1 Tax=Corynebacterium kozikiae TaxID=2968469 RepID=UPI00211CB8D9|nr:LLM class flavin-dependent oxidoreductase [Corynebacterium sp. 76QC2CO]MCQ9342157.1 LLM class flavin-dependent oxidoreductase [Corynebacterium sp. 76QC2CO]
MSDHAALPKPQGSPLTLSILDLAFVYEGEAPAQSFKRSVQLAQNAEALGFSRVWYAEHHNMPRISSSAPAVLISHVGAHTSTIRLGSGGVMLPNHAPYTIAEQFGTLAELYPGRIDLGLGRAPGTDQTTLGRALRRDPRAADSFPQDVVELQQFLAGNSPIPGVQAVPGAGTNVPLYILGSSLFGATLAAKLGLPYAFASHFAPTHLEHAAKVYREEFTPSEALSEPYFIAAVNVTAADTMEQAQEDFTQVARASVKAMAGRGREMTEEQLDHLVDSYAGQQIISMLNYTAIGTAPDVAEYLERFAAMVNADELIVSLRSPNWDKALHGLDILGNAWK